jgi:hypothetical protein
MQRGGFDKYVKETRALGLEGHVLEVDARNEQAREWLTDRVTSSVQKLMIGVMGNDVEVRFVVVESEAVQ